MSILVDENTVVICQGFTGSQGTLHSEQAIGYGTRLAGGVTPGKGGTMHLGRPVFDTVAQAVAETGATASVIYVPARFCKDSILEAADAGISLIVCITEGIPTLDMLVVKHHLDAQGVRLIGPNCPGVITPGECKIGIMPEISICPAKSASCRAPARSPTKPSSRLRTRATASPHASESGGDPIPGSHFIDILGLFEADAATEAIVMVGEIGGTAEEEAADYIAKHVSKPVVAYIAGVTAPPGKRMGHAGAIIAGGKGTAAEKYAALREAGVRTVQSLAEIGTALGEATGWA